MGSYSVLIRKNETGEVRRYVDAGEWDDDSEWIWTEGNYGCDCNREILFERAGGVETDSETCGTDRFDIVKIVTSDGREIEIDDSHR